MIKIYLIVFSNTYRDSTQSRILQISRREAPIHIRFIDSTGLYFQKLLTLLITKFSDVRYSFFTV